jgi:Ca2+-transporting ATPase
VLFVISYFFKGNALTDTLMISMAALVSVIPEGLPAVLSIVLAVGSHRMSQKNAIIREMAATETLGSVTTIVTDKTGTLTQNTMTIRKIWVPGIEDIEVEGEGWESIGDFRADEKDILALESLFEIAAHCHSASVHQPEVGTYQVTGDPTEAAFLVLGNKAGKEKSLEILEDVAFSSELKFRSTLVKKEGESVRFYLGAPEAVLARCTRTLQHDESFLPLDSQAEIMILSKIQSWSKESFRVLALARKSEKGNSNMHEGLDFIGLAGMIDPARPGVLEGVQSCHRAGIRVIMATGDHADTALAIGKKVGIVVPGRERVYSELELATMDKHEFDKAVGEADVFSRLSPGMKLRIAKSLQKQGELLAMTGDGVNDAPALKQADIGIAMGIIGTDVAKDASMMVLADDNFSTIVKAVEQGRIVFNNARRTSFFLASTNFAEISTLIFAVSLGFPMPLTATQILWINLVTDGFCDKALAAEQGKGNELLTPPIPQSEKILNRTVLPFLVINVLLMTGLALAAFHIYLPVSLEKARTMAFITLAFSQLFNVFNMRNLTGSSFKIGLFSNKWVNYALIVSVLIQIAIIETPLSSLFSFEPVKISDFLLWVGLSSSVFWVTELYKFIRFRHNP